MEENLEDDNSNSNSNCPASIKYVRRGDRTPEKDFHLKKTAEKKVICYQRSMMEKVRDKISKLEDEDEERLFICSQFLSYCTVLIILSEVRHTHNIYQYNMKYAKDQLKVYPSILWRACFSVTRFSDALGVIVGSGTN